MTIGEKSEQETVHQIFLAHYNVGDLLAKRRNPLPQFPHFLRNFLRRFHTVFVRHMGLGECSIKRALSSRYAVCFDWQRELNRPLVAHWCAAAGSRQSEDRDMVRLYESGIQGNDDTFRLSAADHSRKERSREVVIVGLPFRALAWRKAI